MATNGWNGYKRKAPVQGNKRVKNAKKTLAFDGTPCDSKLEAYCYDCLQRAGIPFDFKHTIRLFPAIKSVINPVNDKSLRQVTWRIDFYFPWCNIIADTKGYATDTATMKIKITLNFMHEGRLPYDKLYLPKNKKKVNEFLEVMTGKYIMYKSKS